MLQHVDSGAALQWNLRSECLLWGTSGNQERGCAPGLVLQANNACSEEEGHQDGQNDREAGAAPNERSQGREPALQPTIDGIAEPLEAPGRPRDCL